MLDELARDERGEAEDARLRVAAGVGDQLRAGDLVAVDFRQAVDRLGEVGEVSNGSRRTTGRRRWGRAGGSRR